MYSLYPRDFPKGFPKDNLVYFDLVWYRNCFLAYTNHPELTGLPRLSNLCWLVRRWGDWFWRWLKIPRSHVSGDLQSLDLFTSYPVWNQEAISCHHQCQVAKNCLSNAWVVSAYSWVSETGEWPSPTEYSVSGPEYCSSGMTRCSDGCTAAIWVALSWDRWLAFVCVGGMILWAVVSRN